MGDLWHSHVGWANIDSVFNQCSLLNRHTYLLLTKRILAALYYFDSQIYEYPVSRSNYLGTHIWLGITAETQVRLDDRWGTLAQIYAQKYWISAEPMLGPLVIPESFLALGSRAWFVCGPETGPGARPCKKEWIQFAYEQCRRAQIPFFDKSKNPIAREFPIW